MFKIIGFLILASAAANARPISPTNVICYSDSMFKANGKNYYYFSAEKNRDGKLDLNYGRVTESKEGDYHLTTIGVVKKATDKAVWYYFNKDGLLKFTLRYFEKNDHYVGAFQGTTYDTCNPLH